jgi:hypothetical protein
VLLVRLNEGPSGTREYYRAALGNLCGDSPFAQPPLKVVEVGLQLADEQRRFASRGDDCHFISIEGDFDVVRGWGFVVDALTEEDRTDQFTLSHHSPHVSTR